MQQFPFYQGFSTYTKRLFNYVIGLFSSISCHSCIHSIEFAQVINILLIRLELFHIVQYEKILKPSSISSATSVRLRFSYSNNFGGQLWNSDITNIRQIYEDKPLSRQYQNLLDTIFTVSILFWIHFRFWRKLFFLFIVHFCFRKSLQYLKKIFLTHLLFWIKWMFHSLFISVLLNTTAVSIPFEHTLHFPEN